MKRGLKIM